MDENVTINSVWYPKEKGKNMFVQLTASFWATTGKNCSSRQPSTLQEAKGEMSVTKLRNKSVSIGNYQPQPNLKVIRVQPQQQLQTSLNLLPAIDDPIVRNKNPSPHHQERWTQATVESRNRDDVKMTGIKIGLRPGTALMCFRKKLLFISIVGMSDSTNPVSNYDAPTQAN